jgi:hypothetical protein
MKLYRSAIESASRQQFIQDEAIAHECRARFLLHLQEPEFGVANDNLWRKFCGVTGLKAIDLCAEAALNARRTNVPGFASAFQRRPIKRQIGRRACRATGRSQASKNWLFTRKGT